MRKMVAIIAAAGLLASMTAVPARAGGGHGWATAGKILTGVIGLSILSHAIADAHPVHYAPAPRYYEPPREEVWVPGHYEMRYTSRWVPGHWETDRYSRHHGEEDDDYDDAPRGGRVWVPGHYEKVEVRVWIPGHWEERG